MGLIKKPMGPKFYTQKRLTFRNLKKRLFGSDDFVSDSTPKKTREVPSWLDVFGDVSLKKHFTLTPSGKVMTAELCSHDPHVGILALESLN